MERYRAGAQVGGFIVGQRVHAGGMGYLYRVSPLEAPDPGFPLVMKVPAVGHGEPVVGVVGFEMELMILPVLQGPHVPRFVAAGDITTPYLVMEWIDGENLAPIVARAPLAVDEVARLGAAIADALHDLHEQDTVHHDVKPENILLRRDGRVVILDFGFASHTHFPDLLGEEMHFVAGSGPYLSPEQLRNRRGDRRSDIFSLGVLLYALATGEQPFGEPRTVAGIRDRLWRLPAPPRAVRPDVPPWLQEVILRCLETDPALRYQSAAHVAFDLRNAERISLSARAHRTVAPSFVSQAARWLRAFGAVSDLNATPRNAPRAPVILVAVDTTHPDDTRQSAIQWTTRQVLSLNDEYRLMCVSVVAAPGFREQSGAADTPSGRHLEHLGRLRRWVEPLGLPPQRLSLHVLQSPDPASALLTLARQNHVDLIVLGAPGPDQMALAWWRSVASSVTANAHCSVHVVRIAERERSVQAPSESPSAQAAAVP
jgi:serine/threonine protein kinase